MKAHRTGDLKSAMAHYRWVADARPDHPLVWHHMGVAAEDLGQHRAAAELSERALALQPDLLAALINLGRARTSLGELHAGLAAYRRALVLAPEAAGILASMAPLALRLGRPDMAQLLYRRALLLEPSAGEIWAALGGLLRHRRRLAEAERCLRHGLAIRGDHLPTALALGTVLLSRGRADEALPLFKQVTDRTPNSVQALAGLGACHAAMGELETAATAFSAALALKPDMTDARIGLADSLRLAGRPQLAETEARRAVTEAPGNARALNALAASLQALGQRTEAITLYLKSIAQEPGFADARANLGAALLTEGRLGEAERHLQTALQLQPKAPGAWNNLGNVHSAAGDGKRAEEAYRHALALAPDNAEAGSNLLLTLHYRDDVPAEALALAHHDWATTHAGPAPSPPAVADPSTRRLRVGYMSADLRTHSVSYFLEPLLAAHDPDAVDTVCYADVTAPDETTSRLEGLASAWRPIADLSNDAVADLVRADRIDVLVDLGGHTAGRRLLVFAQRPAPVQVTWLGYPNTTGLAAMDARLTDAIADPPGPADDLASERLVRLEHGFLCYLPPPAPEPSPLPAAENGRVTFGSFNNLAKLTPGVIRLWARLVAEVPDARLMLKARALADGTVRSRFEDAFAAAGLPPGRLALIGPIAARDGHLRAYADIDIALDPFPYNGTTTTCEALWMGVPTVTVLGDRHSARVGASLMTHIGLPHLIARDSDDYVRIAKGLAGDIDGLADLRRTLRERMAASPLMNAAGFARAVEAAYRDLCLFRARQP